MSNKILRQHLEDVITSVGKIPHSYLYVEANEARLQLERLITQSSAIDLPLLGRVVAVKDLFDIQGQVTLAGSKLFGPQFLKRAPAECDATAITRLKAAGAITLGRTNTSEFAFSGVGINPHYGTPINPCDSTVARIPGGSSCGSAVAVAAGAADIGLGTDTGGSLRIPAALCGIVGFKGTASNVPQDGCFPLSRSLDTVGAMARSVAEATQAYEVLADTTIKDDCIPLFKRRIAVTRRFMDQGLDATVQLAWERALRAIRDAGVDLVDWDNSLIEQAAAIQAGRSIVTTEAYALHKDWLNAYPQAYDPRVGTRVRMGEHVDKATYEAVIAEREKWISAMSEELASFDAVISPTVPIVAPPISDIAPGEQRDELFLKVNMQLLRNPSVVNFLDGCAASIPCHIQGELPVGLMIWQRGGQDATVLNVARQIEYILHSSRWHGHPPTTDSVEARQSLIKDGASQ